MHFLKRRLELFWMLLGAVLVSLPCLFPSLGILQWVAMIPFFIGFFRFFDADEPPRYRKAYLWGFLALYVYNFVLYHWFVGLYPMDFAGLTPPEAVAVIAAGWLGLPLLQAIPGGALFVSYAFLKRRGVFDRLPILRVFTFSALWVVWEWYSTLSWWGVPWSRLCLGQIELLPVLQNASLLGSYFISFLILTVNALLAYAILYRKRALACSVTATAILVASFSLGGLLLLKGRAEIAKKETLRVAVIQGNISSHEKWESSTKETMLKQHADLTRQAVKDGAEVVLWAETALPYVLNESVGLMNYVSSLARECKVPLIVGALYIDNEGDEYNVLYYVESDGKIREETYAKRHLVPFGEYVPLRELFTFLIPPLEDVSLLEDDLVAGDTEALFENEWGSFGSLICFDSIYEELTRDSVLAGAELLLLSTNDSWFRDSAAVYMHQAQARLRAVESGRWVVRSANTGISSITSPTGEDSVRIAPLTDGYAVADVVLDDTMTPYMGVGDLFVLLSWLFLGALFLFALFPKWQNVFSKDKGRQDLC